MVQWPGGRTQCSSSKQDRQPAARHAEAEVLEACLKFSLRPWPPRQDGARRLRQAPKLRATAAPERLRQHVPGLTAGGNAAAGAQSARAGLLCRGECRRPS